MTQLPVHMGIGIWLEPKGARQLSVEKMTKKYMHLLVNFLTWSCRAPSGIFKIMKLLSKIIIVSLLIAASSEIKALALSFSEFQSLFQTIKQYGSNKKLPEITQDAYEKIVKGNAIVRVGKADADNKFAFVVKHADVSIQKLWAVIIDRAHYHIFTKEITESRILDKMNDHFLTYIFIDAPFPISDRQQLLDCFANKELFNHSNKKMWEHYWKITEGQEKILARYNKNPKKAQLVQKNNGQWILVDYGAHKTLVIAYSINNPGGSVPQSVVGLVAGDKLESAVNTMISWAQKKFTSHFTKDHEKILAPDETYKSATELLGY